MLLPAKKGGGGGTRAFFMSGTRAISNGSTSTGGMGAVSGRGGALGTLGGNGSNQTKSNATAESEPFSGAMGVRELEPFVGKLKAPFPGAHPRDPRAWFAPPPQPR